MINKKYQGKINHSKGINFEEFLKNACIYYENILIAKIEKVPEPFRLLSKKTGAKFEGVFIAKAEPDFQGTIVGGKSIVFEAKYTTTDRFKVSVLTEQQKESLEMHLNLGAIVYVAVGIQDRYFFVPYKFIKENEKKRKKSFKAEDLKEFEVFIKKCGIDFFNYCK